MKLFKDTVFEVFTVFGTKLDLVTSFETETCTVEYYMRNNQTGEVLIRNEKPAFIKRVMPGAYAVGADGNRI